jgi:hypothetical protein
MKQQEVFSSKSDLEAVYERFETWRKTRERGSRIPQTLWDAAVKLTETHSINEVSRVLRLEYNHLKRRVDQSSSIAQSTSCGFIELDLISKTATGECAIEIHRPDGSLMRMNFKGDMDSHLIDLAKAFWSRS